MKISSTALASNGWTTTSDMKHGYTVERSGGPNGDSIRAAKMSGRYESAYFRFLSAQKPLTYTLDSTPKIFPPEFTDEEILHIKSQEKRIVL